MFCRRVEIGLAQGEVEDVDPLRLQPLRLGRHRQGRRRCNQTRPFRQCQSAWPHLSPISDTARPLATPASAPDRHLTLHPTTKRRSSRRHGYRPEPAGMPQTTAMSARTFARPIFAESPLASVSFSMPICRDVTGDKLKSAWQVLASWTARAVEVQDRAARQSDDGGER